jgi:hypothetical protein
MHDTNPLAKVGTIFRFRDLPTARAFAERGQKAAAIVMGDHPYYWVVSPGQAKRLESLGYEILETV